MSNGKISILLVDDKKQLRHIFEVFFTNLLFEPELEFVQPYSEAEDLLALMPRGPTLDRFDVALVDLELYLRPISPVLHNMKDLQGGTKVLPYLRLHAPWLPVIAQTQLITDKALHLLSIVGSFGFDGLLSQALLPRERREDDSNDSGDEGRTERSTLFDIRQWNDMIRGARVLRRAAVLGASYSGKSKCDEPIKMSSALRRSLDDPPTFELLLKVAFYFATEISVEPIAPGHSGAQVFKVVASAGDRVGQRPGYWLVKVSNSPSKLHMEVSKHLEMMLEGIEYGVAVPLLWRDVLVEKRKALIAYKFAEDTAPASAKAMVSIDLVAEPIANLLRKYYGSEDAVAQALCDVLLREFGPWRPNLESTVSSVKDIFRRFADAFLDDDSFGLAYMVSFRQVRIHGDLHLDNIMLGDSAVLIDFSKTAVGPVAADAAKLVSDMLIRLPRLRDDFQPCWNDASRVMTEIQPLIDVFALKTDDDGRLFAAYLSLFLWDALYYDTTDASTRTWICEVLETSRAIELIR